MYIPTQRFLRENEEPLLSSSLSDLFDAQLQPELYYLGVRSTVDPAHEDSSFNVPSAFVGVSVAALVFVLMIIAFTVYKKCNGSDTSSDTESSISDSAWRVEDPESESDATEAKHRKRLRKLDQVAPVQSLHDWRAEKLLTHVETFATVSTKLICAICLDLIGEDEKIRELQCGHVYHSICLNLWVERGHHDCPLCKFDILGIHQNPPTPPVAENTNDDATRSPSPPQQQQEQHHNHHHHHGPHVVVISNAQPQSNTANLHDALSPSDSRRG